MSGSRGGFGSDPEGMLVFDEVIGSNVSSITYSETDMNETLGRFDALAVHVTVQMITYAAGNVVVDLESSADSSNWVQHTNLLSSSVNQYNWSELFGRSNTGNWLPNGRLKVTLPAGMLARVIVNATFRRNPRPFSPLALDGLIAVHDARVGATSSQWDDASGNGNHATQPTSNLQPTVWADDGDGFPAIRFDAPTDDQYIVPVKSSLSDSDYTVYVLYYPNAVASAVSCLWGQGRLSSGIPINYILHINNAGGTTGYLQTSHRDDAVVQIEFANSGTLLTDAWHVAVLRRSGTNFTLRADDTITNSSAANPGTTTVDQAFIGKNAQGAGIPCYLDGRIRHVGLFDQAHSDYQIECYVRYLRSSFPGVS